ncbi:glycine--tRNA ligase [candidate division CPR3 bacterium 4484_211]|uniref:glycine--tRNA ligase n=1 Tax=candidate division CPR3 bacterium 4484_211 TaxID=1968527 RepID=A0A1W9NXE4_UNCC3|nr:MAG: glycine--tRNA ligase [candidate division CPR3 bacterium 4484_211]
MSSQNSLMQKIVSLCKRKGFVYPSSEIYGGLAGFYDYGPLGVELLNNLKRLWWKNTVHERENVYGLDGAILMHPKAWEASGHVAGFTDPLVDCKDCKSRVRPDKLEGWKLKKDNQTGNWQILEVGATKCPLCGGELIPEVRQFNILMETSLGVIEGQKTKAYLKGESCQNIYLDYKNVVESFSPKLPFGIAQIGKAFRNEITLGRFMFKTREFEQWDVEYFVQPEEADKAYKEWKEIRWNWYIKNLKLSAGNLRWRQHSNEERIFYATDAWDIDYKYPWGWDELEGLHHRGNYDLTQHEKFSGTDLKMFNEETGQKILPWIIEASGGVGRTFLALLLENYHEEEVRGRKRIYLSLPPYLAPIQVAILPLVRTDKKLTGAAQEILQALKSSFVVQYDEQGTIGRRYRRQDEIGTPFCLTVDGQTLEDKTVTVRERDSMKQIRVKIPELTSYLTPPLSLPQ